MAGYLFSLNNIDSLTESVNTGIFSTVLSKPKNEKWQSHQEGTFADYCSMKEGDSVYFFHKRKIYGIGSLINVGGFCTFLNYPNANMPINYDYEDLKGKLLYDYGEQSVNYRFVCTFKPYPFFFNNGIDMDEVLSSDPDKFRMLRAFWKLSFIKFSDSENQAFKDVILRRNISALDDKKDVYSSDYLTHHKRIEEKVLRNVNYQLNPIPILHSIINEEGSIKHEMAIEACLISQISNNKEDTIDIFGRWDYISHQVIASPFKPIDYMDKMDVFGYKFIQNQYPTISNYLVIEIKKNNVSSEDILQLMKYVDWVNNEYAYGDYGMIEAFMLGFKYEQEALEAFRDNVTRKYIMGVRPPIPSEWNNVKLIRYSFNEEKNQLDFENITPYE